MLGQQLFTPHVRANLEPRGPPLQASLTHGRGWPPSSSDTAKAPWGSGTSRDPLAPPDTAETVSDHSQIGNEKSGQNAHNFLHVSDGCFLKWLGHISTRFIETSQF